MTREKTAAQIRSFVPPNSPTVVKRLRELDVERVVDFAVDPNEHIWRRIRVLEFLRGRVPSHLRAEIRPLLDDEEIRVAALGVLLRISEDGSLLHWMKQHPTHGPHAVRPATWRAALLHGRRALGDLSVELELSGDLPNPWRAAGPDKKKSVEHELDVIRQRFVEGRDITSSLNTQNQRHARLVFEALQRGPADEVVLRALLVAEGASAETRCWATLALIRLGEQITYSPDSIPLDSVPKDVRAAIIAEYAERCLGTDPRWLFEAQPLPPLEVHDRTEARLVNALDAAGLGPVVVTPGTDRYQIGYDTFDDLHVSEGVLSLSILGPFVCNEDDTPRAEHIVRGLKGFRWIDTSLARQQIPGLPVSMFGSIKNRTVGELLFFWQD